MNPEKKEEQSPYPKVASSPSAEQNQTQSKRELPARINKAFGPIIGGLIIDFFDLATFGPIGIFIGLVVGGVAGYWVGTMYNLTGKFRMLLSAIAGLFCTIPGTGLFPFATITGAIVRFLEFNQENETPPNQR